MPRIPELPPSLRFFGRVERFTCECPKCGHLLIARPVPIAVRKPWRQGERIWNPLSGRLWCPWCRTTFGIGLLVYPVQRDIGARGDQRPADWKPTWQQLCALRQLHGAYLIEEGKAPGDHHNLYVEGACTCLPGGEQREPCPLHRDFEPSE